VQGVRLLAGDSSLLKVELKEEQPDRCEEVIVDKETLDMMKVFSSMVDVPAIRLGLVSLQSLEDDLEDECNQPRSSNKASDK